MIDVNYNYLIGKASLLSAEYNYKNRPDPDVDGCKKLYDDILELFFLRKSLKANNLEQQFRYNARYEKRQNESLWRSYNLLNNEDAKKKSKIYKPPFYTIEYKDHLLSADYIGPSIYWAMKRGMDDSTIIKILNVCSTIGGHIIWPRGKGNTVNCARGGDDTLFDRIDWTLLLVKIYFENKFDYEKTELYFFQNYEKEIFQRCKKVLIAINYYSSWFKEFANFPAFCDFYILKESFVDRDYEVIWFAPQCPIFPVDYVAFGEKNVDAVKSRNEKIGLLFE